MISACVCVFASICSVYPSKEAGGVNTQYRRRAATFTHTSEIVMRGDIFQNGILLITAKEMRDSVMSV